MHLASAYRTDAFVMTSLRCPCTPNSHWSTVPQLLERSQQRYQIHRSTQKKDRTLLRSSRSLGLQLAGSQFPLVGCSSVLYRCTPPRCRRGSRRPVVRSQGVVWLCSHGLRVHSYPPLTHNRLSVLHATSSPAQESAC